MIPDELSDQLTSLAKLVSKVFQKSSFLFLVSIGKAALVHSHMQQVK